MITFGIYGEPSENLMIDVEQHMSFSERTV
jgi:hypothetical protein